jgi:glucose-1-phosphate cytidylyltransferase
MKAVILAGGLGTRLSEETSLKPKPMVEIGGKPILWHIMKMYSHHGVNEFIICVSKKLYFLENFTVQISKNDDELFDVSFEAMQNLLLHCKVAMCKKELCSKLRKL